MTAIAEQVAWRGPDVDNDEHGCEFDTIVEPVDLQFATDHAVMHSRTAFQDHDQSFIRTSK